MDAKIAKRDLDAMIEKARGEADGKWARRIGGKWLTVAVDPDDDNSAVTYMYGDRDPVVTRDVCVDAIAKHGK